MGFSVWSEAKAKFVEAGVVSTSTGNFKSVAESDQNAVTELTNQLATIIGQWNPKFIIAELPVGSSKSSRAGKGMAIAFTVVITTCLLLNKRLVVVKPSEIKRIVEPNSKGRTSVPKEKVISFAGKTFGTKLFPKNAKCEHVADSMVALLAYKARKL